MALVQMTSKYQQIILYMDSIDKFGEERKKVGLSEEDAQEYKWREGVSSGPYESR